MKRQLMTLLAGAALAVPAFAQNAQSPQADWEKWRAERWAQMQKMHEQMDRIQATTDPAEREKLLREHWETMQQGFGGMRGYGPMMGGRGGGMMGPSAGSGRGPGMGGGRRFGYGPYAQSECTKLQDPAERRGCMQDERLDIMQGMMEQMLERQRYGYGPGTGPGNGPRR